MFVPVLAAMTMLLTQGEKVVDFGPEGVGGYPVVEITGVKGPTRVRLCYATHPNGIQGDHGDFKHETRAMYMGPDVWLPIHPANTDRWDWFDVTSNGVYRAACAQGLVRYAKWKIDYGSAQVKSIGFDNDGVHSEEPVVGSFACSDPELDGVWKASIRTCLLAAIPGRDKAIYVAGGRCKKWLGPSYPYLSDGAKRDRLVWSGDLWWAQRNMYVAFASNSPYMPGSIRMLGENQTPEGYVQACPYPESHGPLKNGDWGPFGSDEFAAWFVPVVWDNYFYTGDAAVTREAFPRVCKLMDYLTKHCRASDGFLEPRKETCKHAAGLTFGGTSLHHRTYMNILLWKTYIDAASLADVFGTRDEAARWRAAAAKLAASIRAQQWDGDKGFFVQSCEVRTWGEEANPLALATRFATREEAARIVPQLRRHSHGKFQAMAIRGAYEYGCADKAMALFNQHNWRKLMSPSWKGLRTVTECMGLPTRGWGDEAHPDTAVAGIFTNYLLGVEPLAPGYARFRVKPQPSGLAWAKGRVPTPKGFIDVAWKIVDGQPVVTVTAPPSCTRVE